MNRREIKITGYLKIWTAVSRGEKYKIGAAVQTLETIRFILFRDDSFTRGTSNKRRFIYKSSATNIRDWSMAYSFISMNPENYDNDNIKMYHTGDRFTSKWFK